MAVEDVSSGATGRKRGRKKEDDDMIRVCRELRLLPPSSSEQAFRSSPYAARKACRPFASSPSCGVPPRSSLRNVSFSPARCPVPLHERDAPSTLSGPSSLLLRVPPSFESPATSSSSSSSRLASGARGGGFRSGSTRSQPRGSQPPRAAPELPPASFLLTPSLPPFFCSNVAFADRVAEPFALPEGRDMWSLAGLRGLLAILISVAVPLRRRLRGGAAALFHAPRFAALPPSSSKIQLGAPKYRKRAVRAGRQKTPKFPYQPKDSLFYDFPDPPAGLPLPLSARRPAASKGDDGVPPRAEVQGERRAETETEAHFSAHIRQHYVLRVPPIDQRARRMLWIHRHLGRRDGTLSPVEDAITDLLLSHNVPEEAALDLSAPVVSASSSPSSGSSPSPYLSHLHALAFPESLGLTAAELTRLLTVCPELLLPRRLAACSAALDFILKEKKWSPEAAKNLLLHVPRALTAGGDHVARWMREYRELFCAGAPASEEAGAKEGRRVSGSEARGQDADSHSLQDEADRFLERTALKHPMVFAVRRPRSKLRHFLQVLRQVRASRSEYKPAGWSTLPVTERAKIVAFLSSSSAHPSAGRDAANGAPPAAAGGADQGEDARQEASSAAALELEWYRGHYERLEEFEGETLVEKLLQETGDEKSGGEGASEREALLRPLRTDAARMRAAMRHEEASVKEMFRAYPRLFSMGIAGNVRSKLLYLQNYMHKEVEEVFLFPQFLSYSLRRRIIPRHIALVNAFLLQEKARRKFENPLFDEGKALEQVRKRARTRKHWDDRMREKKRLQLRLEQRRGSGVEAPQEEGSVYDEEYWAKKAMLADEVFPFIDEKKGWRGLEPYQPFGMQPLPPLREMYATSDEKFMELFSIPYHEFVSAKVDAEKVKNPQTLF
ncbi:hypothetical protein BESB_019020 [Besnoitia besnoiti]|uniref:mTERF n=1 Tax=Besnoitia besnoiti TaxID=94643 RepID=A0A2A9M6M9_BESBE|nr:hypothetical protein BESB_019020 [Besnoitia besnoiti]PFH31961.1 hypothetical protein BESB_019020 [Besnoitia besnoiti]